MIAAVSARQKVCLSLEEFLEVPAGLLCKTVFQGKNAATGVSLPKSSEPTAVCSQCSLPRQPEKGLFVLDFLRRFIHLVQPQEGLRGTPLLERVPCSFITTTR